MVQVMGLVAVFKKGFGKMSLSPRRSANRGGAELGGGWFDVALPVLAGEHRAATLTPVGCRRGEPR
jgi:hypothetical protein